MSIPSHDSGDRNGLCNVAGATIVALDSAGNQAAGFHPQLNVSGLKNTPAMNDIKPERIYRRHKLRFQNA